MVSDTRAIRNTPAPVCLAFLLCDYVISDEGTKKKTVVGLFDTIWVKGFPAQHRRAVLYVRLIGAEGQYDATVEYVNVSTEEVLGRAVGKIEVQDRHRPAEFVVEVGPLDIPTAGEYEFRLWLNEHYIQRVGLIAALRTS